MQRETSVYLCRWAESFHSGPQEPFPAARTKHWDTGEAGGVRTKMLVWEPSCHSLLSFSSPCPLLPLFQSSDFSSLSFMYHFLQNVKLQKGLSQVILHFSLLSFKLYCIINTSLQKQTLQFLKLAWYTAHVFRLRYKLKLLLIDEEGDWLYHFSGSF